MVLILGVTTFSTKHKQRTFVLAESYNLLKLIVQSSLHCIACKVEVPKLY